MGHRVTSEKPVYFADLTPRQRDEMMAWLGQFAEALGPLTDVGPVAGAALASIERARRVLDERGGAGLAQEASEARRTVFARPDWPTDEASRAVYVYWKALAYVDYYENHDLQGIQPETRSAGAAADLDAGYSIAESERHKYHPGISKRPAIRAIVKDGVSAPGPTSGTLPTDVAKFADRLVAEDSERYTFAGRRPDSGARSSRRYPTTLIADLEEEFGLSERSLRDKLKAARWPDHKCWQASPFATRVGAVRAPSKRRGK